MARRKRRKKRNFRWVYTLLTLSVIIGAAIWSVTAFMKVTSIEVEGLRKYTNEQIISATGINIGDNLFKLNKFDAINKILKEFPLIEKVNIKRKFPDGYIISITERIERAYFENKNVLWIIDKNGYFMSEAPLDKPPRLCKVIGLGNCIKDQNLQIKPNEEIIKDLLINVLNSCTESDIIDKMQLLDISNPSQIVFEYMGKFKVILGKDAETSRKLALLNAVISELSQSDKGTIDLTEVKQARFRPE